MKEEDGVWRHELKYVCDMRQLKIAESRIRPLLKPDPHAGEGGSYHISSVYFDDEWNTCYRENEDGTDPREKFRIRIYNGSAERITLERKQKLKGMTQKRSCPLTQEQCRSILRGEILPVTQEMPVLLRNFALQQRNRKLAPKVIAEYDRIPYILRLGNVRVTLDENLTSAGEVSKFLDGGYAKRPVMPMGRHVLEVKYDAFLPDPVHQALQLESLQRISFSKFYLCRTCSVR